MTTTKHKKDIDLLIRSYQLMARMNRLQPDARPSQTLYFQLLEKYYTRVRNAHEEGKMVASHTVFFPAEILYAMDIVPMHTEMSTWLNALILGAGRGAG
ncbi:MAG: hypothetical protein JSV77_03705 [Dehalococcoidales bacterium]|nr:MAG: hypothetical protein JSV77_03705 [Dehalococcoidales bacterium]